MVKNPWEFKWSCPDPDWKYKRFYCPYDERYPLPCGTQRTECHECLMYQLSLQDRYNLIHPKKKDKIVHICDRCGQELSSIDLAVFIDISNRIGQTMLTQELCYSCASELIRWAQLYKEPKESAEGDEDEDETSNESW